MEKIEIILANIKDAVGNIWEYTVDVLNFLELFGGVLIIIIGIYTFYRTFLSKKIRFFSLSYNSDIWEGYSVSVSIQNHSLSAMSIDKVELIVDETKKILIKKFDTPILLEPLKVVEIKSDNYPKPLLNITGKFNRKLIVYLSGDINKVIKFEKKNRFNKFKPEKYETINNNKCTYNGYVITEWMKYYLHIILNDGTVIDNYMTKSGYLKNVMFGFNAVPPDVVNNVKELKKIIINASNNNIKEIDIVDISNI